MSRLRAANPTTNDQNGTLGARSCTALAIAPKSGAQVKGVGRKQHKGYDRKTRLEKMELMLRQPGRGPSPYQCERTSLAIYGRRRQSYRRQPKIAIAKLGAGLTVGGHARGSSSAAPVVKALTKRITSNLWFFLTTLTPPGIRLLTAVAVAPVAVMVLSSRTAGASTASWSDFLLFS